MKTLLRSIVFDILFYGWTAVFVLGGCWGMLLPRRYAIWVAERWQHGVYWIEKHILDLDYRVAGAENLPDGPCIVAMKHSSAYETTKLNLILKDPGIILKRELLWIPFWGWFVARTVQIPVKRNAKGSTVPSMLSGARRVVAMGRPISVFPQGTRVKPGVWKPYRWGTAKLYEALNLPVVPIAHNAGVFWPRHALVKRSGIVDFTVFPPIPPGLPAGEMMARLESLLERESDRLVVAAGGPATIRPPEAPPLPEEPA